MEVQSAFWVVLSDTEPDALGLLAKGVCLARERGLGCDAVLVSAALAEEDRIRLSRAGARVIYHLPADPEACLCEAAVREALARAAREKKPEAMLFLSSLLFNSVAPSVAAVLRTGITADCTVLEWEGASLLQSRPAFGGRTLATIRTRTRPVLATVRRGVFPPCDAGAGLPAPVERLPLPELPQPLRLLERRGAREAPATLRRARLVFAGGLGMGSWKQFQALYRLAELTGGQVAASRGAVAAGFAPFSRQVGQTGLTVRPGVYIAFGISGAVQHLSGMIDSEYIVSVNTDPNAPIHRISDYSICADAQQVVSALLEALEKKVP